MVRTSSTAPRVLLGKSSGRGSGWAWRGSHRCVAVVGDELIGADRPRDPGRVRSAAPPAVRSAVSQAVRGELQIAV